MSLVEDDVSALVSKNRLDDKKFREFLAKIKPTEPVKTAEAPPAAIANKSAPPKDEAAFESLIAKITQNASDVTVSSLPIPAAEPTFVKEPRQKKVENDSPPLVQDRDNTGLDMPKLRKQKHSGVRGAEIVVDDVPFPTIGNGVLYAAAGLTGDYRTAKAAAGIKLKHLPEGYDAGIVASTSYSLISKAFQPPTMTASVGYSGGLNVHGLDLNYRASAAATVGKGIDGVQPSFGVRVETADTWKYGPVRDIKPYMEGNYNPLRREGDIKAGVSAKEDFGAATVSINTGIKAHIDPNQGTKVSPYVGAGLRLTF